MRKENLYNQIKILINQINCNKIMKIIIERITTKFSYVKNFKIKLNKI